LRGSDGVIWYETVGSPTTNGGEFPSRRLYDCCDTTYDGFWPPYSGLYDESPKGSKVGRGNALCARERSESYRRGETPLQSWNA